MTRGVSSGKLDEPRNAGELKADQYDGFADQYAAHAEDSPYNALYERPALQALLADDLSGTTVLDAGCAAGGHAAELMRRGAEVVGLDGSAELLERFRRTTRGAETHLCDLAAPLPFLDDERFDIVLCSLVLHYVEDWRTPLREFRRTLKDGGGLIISTHHPSWLPVDRYFEKRIVRDVWRMDGADVPVAFWHRPMEEIIDPLIEAGFRIDAVREPRIPEAALQPHERHLAYRPAFLMIRARKL